MKHIIDYKNSKALTAAIARNSFTAKVVQSELLGLAKAAFHHADEFGNTNPISLLVKGMHKSQRKNSIIAWVCAHSPLKWEKNKKHPDGVFLKDKDSDKQWDLMGAMKADPFKAPSKEGEDWTPEMEQRAIAAVINNLAKLNEHRAQYDLAEMMQKADEVTAKRIEKAMKKKKAA